MFLKKIFIAATIFASTLKSSGQTSDNFTDGNFTNNPVWLGDDSLFAINSNLQLQSKGTPGTSRDISLATASTQRFGGEWSCWLRFALNPSSQNFCRFYLCSDQPGLKGSLNGFYVQLGGSTGNTDSICLYKQNGLNRTRLISGRAGTVAKLNNAVQLKVICDSIGNWQLFSDTSSIGNFVSEGTAFDNITMPCFYTGFFVRFTSGNISNYYFDDLYVGPQRFDTTKPFVTDIEIITPQKLLLSFSEKIADLLLLNPLNYNLDQFYNPFRIINNSKPNSIELIFTDSFKMGSVHTLKLTSLIDQSGNTINDTTLPFNYYIPQQNDLLITEILPDPDPPQGLPNAEFIELYNNSKFPIQLKNYKLKDALTTAALPSFILAPDSFVIVCESTSENLFTRFGQVLPVSGLPSLNNTGDQIWLLNINGETIFNISYELSWYHNPAKQNGGWSLEIINPNNTCSGADNWQASDNAVGGTPCHKNSAWQVYTDTLAPILLNVIPDSANAITLQFNEPVDSILSRLFCEVQLSSGITAHQLNFGSAQTKILNVKLETPLQHLKTYQLQVSNAFDCKANQKKQVMLFTYTALKDPLQNQLLINEIMFSPTTATSMPNAEFMELYNAGEYAVNLKDYTISDGTSTAKFPAVILYPDSFLLVSGTSNAHLLQQFGTAVGLTDFPSLSTDEKLTLYNDRGFVLHQITYKESYLNNTLKQQLGGWTIEMKDSKNPCGTLNNWSASLNAKGGTPGKTNSIKQTNKDNKPPQLLRSYPIDSTHLRCYFNENIDSLSNGNLTGISITKNIHPVKYRYATTNLNELEYAFENKFDTGIIFRIYIDSLRDCAGNQIAETASVEFGIPQKADSGDIVINEVLFNPALNGNDFVELYNKSNKFIDLNMFMLARYNNNHQPEQAISLSGKGYMVAPQSYIVITSDPIQLMTFYTVPYPEKLMDFSLPALNDDAGSLLLINKTGNIMDQLIYTDKMHFELLNNKDGVSLERVDPNRASDDVTNWTSAASNCGYATPSYRNSQYTAIIQKGFFTIEPEVFSPDDDGYKDILTFSYNLASNGNVGKIEIYNSTGNLIKKVCSNYYLGAIGQISWNGVTDEGQKAGIGVYIANFETFNLLGEKQQFQKTFVVGSK